MTTRAKDSFCQCVRTRYHGPTNAKGARISASYAGGRIYVSCNDTKMIHDRRDMDNHGIAAVMLAEKLGWDGLYAGGWFNGDCYWVRVDKIEDGEE